MIYEKCCVYFVWFGLVLWHIYHCSLFNTKSILLHKTVLFQIVQFSISILFNSIYPINRTLSGATIPDQSGPGSDGNEGVLSIPQRPSITGTSTLDCLVSYLGHSLRESNPAAVMLSVYSAAPSNWVTNCHLTHR